MSTSDHGLPPASEPFLHKLHWADKVFGCGGYLPRAYRLPIAATLWFIIGIGSFVYIEGYEWETAVFVVAQIVTTVGYGDITPEQQSMKLFLSFYALLGIGIAASFLDTITDFVVGTAQEATRRRMRALEDAVLKGGSDEEISKQSREIEEQERSMTKQAKVNQVIVAFCMFCGTIGFGTLYFGYLDNCQCDEGAQACDVPEWGGHCPDTKLRTVIDAFYMCCITITTIGFGDQTPQTKVGRLVGTVWMIVGIAVTMNLIGQLTYALSSNRHRVKVFTRELYDDIPKDERGRIHKWQFIVYMLQKYDFCEKEDIDFIMATFYKLDVDKTGKLTLADLPSAKAARVGWNKIRGTHRLGLLTDSLLPAKSEN